MLQRCCSSVNSMTGPTCESWQLENKSVVLSGLGQVWFHQSLHLARLRKTSLGESVLSMTWLLQTLLSLRFTFLSAYLSTRGSLVSSAAALKSVGSYRQTGAAITRSLQVQVQVAPPSDQPCNFPPKCWQPLRTSRIFLQEQEPSSGQQRCFHSDVFKRRFLFSFCFFFSLSSSWQQWGGYYWSKPLPLVTVLTLHSTPGCSISSHPRCNIPLRGLCPGYHHECVCVCVPSLCHVNI